MSFEKKKGKKKTKKKDDCISFLESLKNDLTSFTFIKLYRVR